MQYAHEWETHHDRDRYRPTDREGFHYRSGGSLVSRLRRLCDPEMRSAHAAGAGSAARKHRLCVGHRLRGPFSLLHVHVRIPHDSRTRAGYRHRDQARQSGLGRLDRHRRRRCPQHRRQPPDSRVATQRRCPDPVVQQRDLRTDERPVLAHVTARHPVSLHAQGIGGEPYLGRRAGPGRRWAVRRAHRRHPPEADAPNLEARV